MTDDAELLREHLTDRYGIRVTALLTLDQDVILLRRDDGPNWVARWFAPGRALHAALGDAEILRWLDAQGFPAERCATDEPVSELDGRAVLVTEAVATVPRSERRTTIKDAGGLRGLGSLMGELHTLPADAEACSRPGGAWHHIADGSPAAELAAAGEMLDEALEDALEAVDDCAGLPEALIHPDFVLANVVATPGPGMVVVDWAGAGRGPRLWSLAFLLWAEGVRDIRRAALARAGYSRHVQLEPEEVARLEAVIPARSLVFDIWRLQNHGMAAAEAAERLVGTRRLARLIAEGASERLGG
jgi:Ser/Thr protein kinase RdoA (MazF antagonist)